MYIQLYTKTGSLVSLFYIQYFGKCSVVICACKDQECSYLIFVSKYTFSTDTTDHIQLSHCGKSGQSQWTTVDCYNASFLDVSC